MNTSLVTIIGAVIILAILAVVVYFVFKKKAGTKALAEEFLKGLEEHLTNSVVEIIKSMKPDDYSSLEEYETAVLNKIYDDTWDYVDTEAKKAFEDNQIIEAVLSVITKDMVIKFIDEILENIGGAQMIQDSYVSQAIESSDIEEEDKAAEEEYSDQDKYVEESDNSELPEAEKIEPTEEEAAALNPQTDNDEEYNVEDDSMELVTDKTEIITGTDKNGNTLYYEVSADGKKKRVSKDYALANM